MKILAIGDFHLTPKRPRNRTDSYADTCLRKLDDVCEYASSQGVSVIVCPGDFTDEPTLPYWFFSEILRRLQTWLYGKDMRLLTVYGQHDLRYRTEGNTALDSLETALRGRFTILRPGEEPEISRVRFYGASYGKDIPEPGQDGHYSVLLAHRMIIESSKLWSGQKDYEPAQIFLRKHPFNLVVSGDNHNPFHTTSRGGRLLFNNGAILRSDISQANHRPRVALIDTDRPSDFELHDVAIEPASGVFRMDEVQAEQKINENLEAYIEAVRESSGTAMDIGLGFKDNFEKFCRNSDVPPEVAEIVRQAWTGL